MLPRRYHPDLQNNIFELRAASIAKQLFGEDMSLDYDQFLGKKPKQQKAAFAMHQDMAYWPPQSPDTRTATVSLAINEASLMSGCLQVVPGSQKDQTLRAHRNAISNDSTDRENSHAQTVDILPSESIEHCPLEAGDVTVHDEWIIHGSGGNKSDQWRKTYVIAFRSNETVAWERQHGFTHSHNDEVNWDTFHEIGA
jgi:ectoine hydroxylase-related dioxygenase (phytanoyl-CoA dioxygenase family)